MTKLQALEHWCRVFPVAAISTFLLFAVVLYALIDGRARRWFSAKFVTPMPSTHNYTGALDSYRGIAAVVVAFGHMVYFCYPVFWNSLQKAPNFVWHGGHKAVPVFAILSGFLIFRSVRKIGCIQDFRDYIRCRFLRIYPLYFFTVLVGIAFGQMLKITAPNVFAEVFMLQCIFYPGVSNPPAWSIFVEMSFYFALPVFVLAAGRKVVLASTLVFCALLFAGSSVGARELHLWKFFFVGIVVSHVADLLFSVVKRRVILEVLGAACLFAGGYIMYVDIHAKDWFGDRSSMFKNPYGYTIGCAVGFALIMIGTLSSGILARIVGIWPLRFLGTISYSIYLIHMFYIQANFPTFKFLANPPMQFLEIGKSPWWFGFFVFLPGLIFWSAISYLVIERPFLLMRPKKVKEVPEEAKKEEPPKLRIAA